MDDEQFDYFKNIDDAISKLPIEKTFNPWYVPNEIQNECDREPGKLDPNDDLEIFSTFSIIVNGQLCNEG
jgi:hypothetical protein